jgi:hypothetical protein
VELKKLLLDFETLRMVDTSLEWWKSSDETDALLQTMEDSPNADIEHEV